MDSIKEFYADFLNFHELLINHDSDSKRDSFINKGIPKSSVPLVISSEMMTRQTSLGLLNDSPKVIFDDPLELLYCEIQKIVEIMCDSSSKKYFAASNSSQDTALNSINDVRKCDFINSTEAVLP